MKKIAIAILIAAGAQLASADGLKSLESFMKGSQTGRADFTQVVTSPPKDGQVMEPRLASVLTPRERMGRIGAERLLARIRGEAITPKMLDLGFTLSPGGSI